MERRFGPTLGSGTVIIEAEAEKLLSPGALGVTSYLTILERGDEGKILSTFSKNAFTRMCGGRIPENQGPDACVDFWDHSNGSGELHLVRVTDGTGRQSSLTLRGRMLPAVEVVKLTGHNVGRWGGREQQLGNAWTTTATDLTDTLLATNLTMLVDEWKGGFVYLDEVETKRYEIVSNTADGDVVVKSNSRMFTDYTAAAGSDKGFTLVLEPNEDKVLAVRIGDGEVDPDNNFSLQIYLNGQFTGKNYPDLSMDPDSKYYFVKVLNDDEDNVYLLAEDLNYPGAVTPASRPAPFQGQINTLTATVLTKILFQTTIVPDDATVPNPVVVIGTTDDNMKFEDRITITMTGAAAGTVVSEKFGPQGTIALAGGPPLTGTTVPTSPYVPAFTITNGATVLATDDQIIIDYLPWEPGAHIGETITPSLNTRLTRFRVVDSDHKSVTVAQGDMTATGVDGVGTVASTGTAVTGASTFFTDDFEVGDLIGSGGEARRVVTIATDTSMTVDVAFGDDLDSGSAYTIIKHFSVSTPKRLGGGYDGLAGINDTHYTNLLDLSTSPFNALKDLRKGLVKIQAPSKTSQTIQRAVVSYSQFRNWTTRYEIPANITTESGAVDYAVNTLGKSDFVTAVCLPSYGYVDDQDRPGLLKICTLTGMIHGREALCAKNADGYHQAAAGIPGGMTLPRFKKFPADSMKSLNDEVLNPNGLQHIKFVGGLPYVWGDRSLAVDPTWRMKHQREQILHYENLLAESFDFIIFAINDPVLQPVALAALRSFFYPEWVKKAIRGDTVDQAVIIKVDGDINNNITRANQELNAQVKPRLADTVERFNIKISKQGIFDGAA